MPLVVGVLFRNSGKIYHFDPNDLELKIGDKVIVETTRGSEIAKIVTDKIEISEEELQGELKPIVRLASSDDIIIKYNNRLQSYRALRICKKKIRQHGLDMKLVDVEFALDSSKIIFYFSAEGRIDFRNLVRELAMIFKKRIELHQIGVRDEAKILGGIGPCGRHVCCNSFMGDFAPVSIKMAKEQNLSLNPERISGTCGRFMCCLKYEHDVYTTALKRYPPIGSIVPTKFGDARVIEYCIAKSSILVEHPTQGVFELPIDIDSLPDRSKEDSSMPKHKPIAQKTKPPKEQPKATPKPAPQPEISEQAPEKKSKELQKKSRNRRRRSRHDRQKEQKPQLEVSR